MINEEDINIEFRTDEEKLALEEDLARMHVWFSESSDHIKVVHELFLQARPGSRMTEFLGSPNATADNLIGLIAHLVHNNFKNEFFAIRVLMELSEEGIADILSGKEKFRPEDDE